MFSCGKILCAFGAIVATREQHESTLEEAKSGVRVHLLEKKGQSYQSLVMSENSVYGLSSLYTNEPESTALALGIKLLEETSEKFLHSKDQKDLGVFTALAEDAVENNTIKTSADNIMLLRFIRNVAARIDESDPAHLTYAVTLTNLSTRIKRKNDQSNKSSAPAPFSPVRMS